MSGETWKADSTAYITPRSASQGDAWAEEAAREGKRGTQRLVEVVEVLPPADVTAALGIAPGEPAVLRRRVMLLDGQPVELTDTYYPTSVARGTGLAEQRKIRGGANRLVAELGYAPTEVVEDVTVDAADAEARAHLDLPEGEPVLVLRRTRTEADGRPIEVSVMKMLRGAHLTYRTETT